MFAPHSPSATDILGANLTASGDHLLGTDPLGRDIYSRLLYGARLSLLGPAIVVCAATLFGTSLAIASAWWGGRLDRVIARGVDVLFAFPALLVAILAVAIFGHGLWAPVVALAIAYTPYLARVVRTVAVRERSLPYIDALHLAGLSGWRICTRHILPNVLPMVRAQATIGFGSALVDLAGISFLGLGVQAPDAEWGLMVSDGRSALLNGYPMESISAGFMIIVTVVAFNVLGERLAQRSEVDR
ncbi:ABC transporter permease [Streptomyces sp. NPDC096311]|uniref:ABC transporter permease n=1 Tax=Streptomyces sp. NPDC096311 TaxID=3366083 RepID=UPI0038182DB2